MSHLRKGAGGDSGTHGRSVGPRKSDNAVAASVSPNTKACRSRSKNKIPKAVRYDLENALLSLCDVWFDEIKPHLVANGIKLHVHGGEASGDHAAPGTCPHLHPASSASECQLCRLLSNAASCIDSAVSQAACTNCSPIATTFGALGDTSEDTESSPQL